MLIDEDVFADDVHKRHVQPDEQETLRLAAHLGAQEVDGEGFDMALVEHAALLAGVIILIVEQLVRA